VLKISGINVWGNYAELMFGANINEIKGEMFNPLKQSRIC